MQVVTILAQSSDSVRHYIEETGLPFDILVDESRAVVKAYCVWHPIGLAAWNIAKPAVFLVDRSGAVRYSFIADRQAEFPEHAEILAAIERLRA